jgi:outer membrane lipoprotein-sorting protein
MKMKADKTQMSMADPFAAYREDYDLSVLPEEKIDGETAYVIQATPKEKTTPGMSKTLNYYRKSDGIMLKMVMYGEDGKPMSTITYSDIKVNADIPAERFVFKAPPGVQVMDMSAAGHP